MGSFGVVHAPTNRAAERADAAVHSIFVCMAGVKAHKRYKEYLSMPVKPEGAEEFLARMTRDELLTVAAAAIHEYERRETQS